MILLPWVTCNQSKGQAIIQKGNLTYDLRFAELAIQYLETKDSSLLQKIAELNSTDHIFNHAAKYNYDVPKNSKIDLVTFLLSPIQEKNKLLPEVKRNLEFAKEKIATIDLAQTECLKYLPDSFTYSGSLFFTFGYDIGVVYENNASLNLAYKSFVNYHNEIKYYAIHELHHAGFVALKKNYMPSLEITTYKEMAELIEYFTHLEGMATYAALDLRKKENALNNDKDYIALQDSSLMKGLVKEYVDVYIYFKKNPDRLLTKDDWEKLSIFSDTKRLWYRVGALMAQEIDRQSGRENLTALIAESSEKFINTYLTLSKSKF